MRYRCPPFRGTARRPEASSLSEAAAAIQKAVEQLWARGRARRRRPRWVPAVFYLGLLLLNLSLMLFFGAGAWNGAFLDFYARIVPSSDGEPAAEAAEPLDSRREQYPPAENWTGEEEERGQVAPILRPGPPLK